MLTYLVTDNIKNDRKTVKTTLLKHHITYNRVFCVVYQNNGLRELSKTN